jgi:hypothetical protein
VTRSIGSDLSHLSSCFCGRDLIVDGGEREVEV